MTDRAGSLTVVLDKNYRVDDLEALMNAINLFPGVFKVVPEVAENISEYIEEQRVRRELGDKLWAVLYPKDRA